MHSHNHQRATPKKSNVLRNILFLVAAVIILIGFYFHVQNQAVVIGGAIIIIAHLAIAGGAAHILPTLKKRFYGE